MLLDNTQLIRGMVKTPASQLVAKGYARRGLMGIDDVEYRNAFPWVSVRSASGQLRDKGHLPARAFAGLRPIEEITDLDWPDQVYSTGTPLVTRRTALGGLGQAVDGLGQSIVEGEWDWNPSAPASTSSDVSTVMTAVNSEIGYLVNLARAQAGKPPLSVQATSPGVRVGLDTASLKPLLPFALTALLGWLVLRR